MDLAPVRETKALRVIVFLTVEYFSFGAFWLFGASTCAGRGATSMTSAFDGRMEIRRCILV